MIVNYGSNAVIGFNSMEHGRTLRHHHNDYLSQFSHAFGGDGLPLPIGEWMRFSEIMYSLDHQEIPEISIRGWHFYQNMIPAYHEWHAPRNEMTLNLYGGLADLGGPAQKSGEIISAEYRMCLGRIAIEEISAYSVDKTSDYPWDSLIGERTFIYHLESAIEKIIFTAVSGAFAFFSCAAPGSRENQRRLDGTLYGGIHWRTAGLFAKFLGRSITYVYENGFIPWRAPHFDDLFSTINDEVVEHKFMMDGFPEEARSNVDVIFDPDFLYDFTRYTFQSFDMGGSLYNMSNESREKLLPKLLEMTPVMQSVFKFYYDCLWIIANSRRQASTWQKEKCQSHFLISLSNNLDLNHGIKEFNNRISTIFQEAANRVLELLRDLHNHQPVMGHLMKILPDITEEELLTASKNLFMRPRNGGEECEEQNKVGNGFVVDGFHSYLARFDF